LSVIEDIHARKQAELALRRHAERLEVLQEIDQAILAAQSSAELGHAALDRMRRLVPCQRAELVLMPSDRVTDQVIAVSLEGNNSAHSQETIPLTNDLGVEIAGEGLPRYIEDLALPDGHAPTRDRLC